MTDARENPRRRREMTLKHTLSYTRKQMIRAFTNLIDDLTERDLHGIEDQVGELLDFYNMLCLKQEEELQQLQKEPDDNAETGCCTVEYLEKGTIVYIRIDALRGDTQP